MTGRQLFFGGSFMLLGGVILLLNRLLTEEGLRTGRWMMPWRHPKPLLGRILIVVGGIVSMLLGVLLLAGSIK